VQAGYLALHQTGELARRAEQALALLEDCQLCPRACAVDRRQDELGTCETGRSALLASYNPHFGEEGPLVGRHGSGTIFFGSCNLLCSFCQNHDISHLPSAKQRERERRFGGIMEVGPEALASVMLELQERGCHNINFVSPSHVVPQILEALPLAAERGLSVPLVYNSGGYDSVETLRLLDGVVDIYMPDFKFWDGAWSERYCAAADYPEVARAALREMHRQVGVLSLDAEGVATRGLLVRHLVMPEDAAGTPEVMRFLAEELSPDTYVNVMDQYRPCGGAVGDRHIGHRPTPEDYQAALAAAGAAGLHRLDNRERRRMILLRY